MGDYLINPWMMLPFGALLGTIALAPLFFPHWWERHYPKVALALAAVTLGYYLGVLPAAAKETVRHTGHEYVSFIALVGSLFVVSSWNVPSLRCTADRSAACVAAVVGATNWPAPF